MVQVRRVSHEPLRVPGEFSSSLRDESFLHLLQCVSPNARSVGTRTAPLVSVREAGPSTRSLCSAATRRREGDTTVYMTGPELPQMSVYMYL